jgi:hypothetical protein
MPEIRISPRERLVLTAIIELYIATGEPVASQAVADRFAHKEGLSSATIRNVMASPDRGGISVLRRTNHTTRCGAGTNWGIDRHSCGGDFVERAAAGTNRGDFFGRQQLE